jgi:hypothetical protein
VGAIGADGGESRGGDRLMKAKRCYRFYYFLIIALLIFAFFARIAPKSFLSIFGDLAVLPLRRIV